MTDSKDHILYNKEKASEGKFAFTTDDQDVFKICFTSESQGGFQRGKNWKLFKNFEKFQF